jgi:succinoglycan biosynthesis protein ExoV
MKLFYYQRPDGLSNFGDQLNSWLWERLLPGAFTGEENVVFVGTGTLLNHLLPQRIASAKKVLIFSTGAGYERKLTAIPEHWRIYCVRGLLSARQLGLPAELALTDGAMLVRRLWQPAAEKTSSFAFMPHVHHAKAAGAAWLEVCQQLGFQYIDPCWSVEQVLTAISQTRVLLAEAMHGAIAAEALRIPWIPIITSPRILTFKWQDWCSSVGLDYQPHYVMPLWPFYPRSARGLRSSISYGQYWLHWLSQTPWRTLYPFQSDQRDWVAAQLERIAHRGHPQLSSDARIEHLTVALEEKLDQLHDLEGHTIF